MTDIQVIPNRDLPEHLHWQIITIYRTRWGELAGRRTEWYGREIDRTRVHFVIVEDQHLITHATVHTQSITIGEETVRILGIGGVYTFYAYRGEGYASKIMRAIGAYADAHDEIAMSILFCKPELQALYESVGWTRVDNPRLLYGDREQSQTVGYGYLMARYAGSVTQTLKNALSANAVYLGSELW